MAECWETLLCDTTALEAVAPIHSRGMPLRLSRDSPRRHGRPLQSQRPPPPPPASEAGSTVATEPCSLPGLCSPFRLLCAIGPAPQPRLSLGPVRWL